MDGSLPPPAYGLQRPVLITTTERHFDRLEAEITGLWAHINAVTYRFLELIAEFDRSEGWAYHGVANCAQWLNLKCGIGPVAAREKVRVARALESLPKISDAFRHGQVSYSKVRAMTRIATPASEDTLLNVALYGTASHVERLVRLYRRVERTADREQVVARQQSRYVNFGYDEDGSVMMHARLSPEVGALVKQAIESAMATQAEDVSAETSQYRTGTSTSERDYEDARDPVGARRADALALIAEQFLAKDAKNSSVADRYQVVVHIDQSLLASEPEGTGGMLNSVSGRCEIEDGPALAVAPARRLACNGHLVGIVEDNEGEPLNVGRKTRAISSALNRALKSRDGGCRFPGCDRTHFTEAHHIQHWADGGETCLGNLVTLCWFHHHLLHEGGFSLRVADDGAFVFTRPDGVRVGTDGRACSTPTPIQCFRGNISDLNRELDVKPRPVPGWHGERMDYGLAIEALRREQQWERVHAMQ